MDEFKKLPIEVRRSAIGHWHTLDTLHNSRVKTINAFQCTNAHGRWRINERGNVSVLPTGDRSESVILNDEDFEKLCAVEKVKNTDWKCKHTCLDTSSATSWLSFKTEKHVQKAIKNELKYGGGAAFRCVPAKIVAAKLKIDRIHKNPNMKWWNHMKPRSAKIKS